MAIAPTTYFHNGLITIRTPGLGFRSYRLLLTNFRPSSPLGPDPAPLRLDHHLLAPLTGLRLVIKYPIRNRAINAKIQNTR